MYYQYKAAEVIKLILQSVEQPSNAIERILTLTRPQPEKRKWIVILQNTASRMKKRHFKILSHLK